MTGAGAATGAGAGAGAAVCTTAGAGMFHCAVHGWPTWFGPEPLAAGPAVQGCPTCTVQPEPGPELAAEPALELAAELALELAAGLDAALAAEPAPIASDDGARCDAQPAVSTRTAAEAANDQFFI
jgi:hypothetical protein